MWTFSIREIVLTVTVFCIAMAVNVWNHRELRAQLEQSQKYSQHVESYSKELHCQLQLAKTESAATNAMISGWQQSGELKLNPPDPQFYRCGSSGSSGPNWAFLNVTPPWKK